MLCGAHDITAFKRIRGSTISGWYANEVTLQHQELIDEALKRVSTSPSLIIWDCNPSSPNHHIYKNFISKEGLIPKMRCHNFTIYDNAENIPEDYIDLQKAVMSERQQKLYLDGLWVGSGDSPFENLLQITYSKGSFLNRNVLKTAFLDPAIGVEDKKGVSDSALAIVFESERMGRLVHIFFGFMFKGGYQNHLDDIFEILKKFNIDLFFYEENLVGKNTLEALQQGKYSFVIDSMRNTRPKLARISSLIVPIEKNYLIACDLGDQEFIDNVRNAELSDDSPVKLDAIDALESCYRIVIGAV
jgi:hypothetical protein